MTEDEVLEARDEMQELVRDDYHFFMMTTKEDRVAAALLTIALNIRMAAVHKSILEDSQTNISLDLLEAAHAQLVQKIKEEE